MGVLKMNLIENDNPIEEKDRKTSLRSTAVLAYLNILCCFKS